MNRGKPGTRRNRALVCAMTAALVTAAGVACSDSFGVDASDAAVVFGRVTTRPGSPVAGARIDVTAFSGICGSNVFSSVDTRTDSTGHYVTSVISFRRRLRSCVEVRAAPPEGVALSPRVVRLPSVSPSGAGLDSLEVNLVLDSAGSG